MSPGVVAIIVYSMLRHFDERLVLGMSCRCALCHCGAAPLVGSQAKYRSG